jgi:hypothetical protein
MRPVGDQRHALAAVLEHAERRGQLVQFRHAVGARALETDHHDQFRSSSPALKARALLLVEKQRTGPSIVQRS